MTARPLLDIADDVLDQDEFRDGLAAGVVTAGVVAALGAGAHARRLAPLPIVALAGVAAAMVGLRRSIGLPTDARNGLLLLVLAGVLAVLVRRPVTVGVLASVLGAYVLAGATRPHPSWAEMFVIVTAVIGGAAIAAFDAGDVVCIGPALLAVSVAAIYVTVPDTELLLVLMGAIPLLAVVGWPLRWARLGAAGAFAIAGLLAWVATIGGTGRPASIIAGFGALGLFVVVPVAEGLARAAGRSLARRPPLVLFALHAGCVAITARAAGVQHSVGAALAIAAAGFVAAGAIYTMLCLALAPAPADSSSSQVVRTHGGT